MISHNITTYVDKQIKIKFTRYARKCKKELKFISVLFVILQHINKMLTINVLSVVTVVTSCFLMIPEPNSAARILAMVPTPSYSHQNAFYPLWTELSLRGHEVILLTTDPINNSSLTNLTEIDLHDIAYDVWNRNIQGVFEKTSPSVYSLLNLFYRTQYEIIDKELDDPRVKAILNNNTEHFDLFIIEQSALALYVFALRFKCPFIVVSSFDGLSWFYRNIGSPANPIINPDMLLAYNEVLNFKDRVTSVTLTLLFDALMYFHSGLDEFIAKKHFELDYNDMKSFENNASMLFVNSNPIFFRVRPLAPNVIQFGGATHIKPLQPLPEELKSFLDGANKGFIYFSLGSNVKSKDLRPELLKTLLLTFSELPYKVLWKFELKQLNSLPNNVMISKWLPQQDVLRHPNIKLFITQGGLQSLEEALHSHVPIVGLPFFGDQDSNIKRAVDKGMGLSADRLSLNQENFKNIILEVINNSKYRNRVKHLSDLIQDQPMSGLERAVWWTEYVIRHKGAAHFRSPVLDIPFYQYYLLDVIGFYVAVLLILIYIVFKVMKLLYQVFRYIFRQNLKLKSQ